MKRVIFTIVAFWACFAMAQSSQERLNRAWELWKECDCGNAIAELEKVKARMSDFPEQLRPQIEATYTGWQDTIAKQKKLLSELSMALPYLHAADGAPLAIADMQTARQRIADVIVASDQIVCKDIRTALQQKALALQESANVIVDNYIDVMISENVRLSKAVDSLRHLARRYHQLLPVLDSLRAIIAANVERLDFVQAKLDTMVMMASQVSGMMRRGTEIHGTEITSPTQIVANALLEVVESKLIAIGEGKVRPRKYKDEQKDSLMSEINAIAAWLDTSMVAKSSQQRAVMLRELAYGYMNMLAEPQKKRITIWLIVTIILAIMIIAIIQAVLRRKK